MLRLAVPGVLMIYEVSQNLTVLVYGRNTLAVLTEPLSDWFQARLLLVDEVGGV